MESMVRKLLSSTLKRYRIESGLSQEKMAEKLKISWRAYNNIENARNNFSQSTLILFLLLLPEHEVHSLLFKIREFTQKGNML